MNWVLVIFSDKKIKEIQVEIESIEVWTREVGEVLERVWVSRISSAYRVRGLTDVRQSQWERFFWKMFFQSICKWYQMKEEGLKCMEPGEKKSIPFAVRSFKLRILILYLHTFCTKSMGKVFLWGKCSAIYL